MLNFVLIIYKITLTTKSFGFPDMRKQLIDAVPFEIDVGDVLPPVFRLVLEAAVVAITAVVVSVVAVVVHVSLRVDDHGDLGRGRRTLEGGRW